MRGFTAAAGYYCSSLLFSTDTVDINIRLIINFRKERVHMQAPQYRQLTYLKFVSL